MYAMLIYHTLVWIALWNYVSLELILNVFILLFLCVLMYVCVRVLVCASQS